jgi:hypothetical protein
MPVSIGLKLRAACWAALPSAHPGVTREQLTAAMAKAGFAIMPNTFSRLCTAMRETASLHSTIARPPLYWRGPVAPPEPGAGAQPNEWRPWEIRTLHTWWGKKSAAEIGKVIKRSKDAVVDKAHREKLPVLASPIVRNAVPPTPPSPRGREGDEPLPAGHPITWAVVVAHTHSISQRWPG